MSNGTPQAVEWVCSNCGEEVAAMVVPELMDYIDVSCPECGYDDINHDPRRRHTLAADNGRGPRQRKFRLRETRPL